MKLKQFTGSRYSIHIVTKWLETPANQEDKAEGSFESPFDSDRSYVSFMLLCGSVIYISVQSTVLLHTTVMLRVLHISYAFRYDHTIFKHMGKLVKMQLTNIIHEIFTSKNQKMKLICVLLICSHFNYF